jgi:hypothetical protein
MKEVLHITQILQVLQKHALGMQLSSDEEAT